MWKEIFSSPFPLLILMYVGKMKSFRNAYTSARPMPPDPNRNEMTLEATASGCIVFYGLYY